MAHDDFPSIKSANLSHKKKNFQISALVEKT